MAEPPELIVAGRDAWRRWLEANHAAGSAVNLVLARKGVSDPTSLDYQDALQEALCFGWIDGRTGQRDERTFRVWFGARRPKSVWSLRNVGIVERLIAEGRMAPAGLAAVEAAKADGRWAAAYGGSRTIEVPSDLADALAATPAAAAAFERLSAQNRYAFLYRLTTAKRPETRARRLAATIEMLEAGRTHYPQRER